MEMNFEQIKNILAQRFPMMMVDKVLSCESGKKITCLKNVSGNDIFFLGHFPFLSVMPGVLIAEAMAQASAILLGITNNKSLQDYRENPAFLGSINKMRFMKPVVPGDQMIIEIEAVKLISNAGIVTGKVMVNGELVAKGELSFGSPQKKE
jgi:3-hydroxyacyl-[acyl-carrier-protein] dehydratase